MEQTYKAYANEAIELASRALNEKDREFWFSIARAWLDLIETYIRPK